MNIAFIGHYSENGLNGVSVTGYVLAKALVEQGHSVFFYYISDKEFVEKEKIGVLSRSFKRESRFRLPQNMIDFFKKNPDQIDIFHIHSVFYPNNTLVAAALHKFKLPYVITPHGGYDPHVFQKNWLKKQIYYYLFEKQMIERASSIFCVTDRESEDLEKLSYKGMTLVTYNPIEPIPLPKKNISPSSRKTVLFLGRYDMNHKGLDILLHIFKEINALDKNIDLQLYGKGGDKENLIALSKQLGVENVYINDPISGSEKFELLSQATIAIMPSRWEAFGTASFEAAMMGVPVAVSRSFNMSDFIEKHQLGIILESDIKKAAQQIKDFVNNQELLAQISSKNRETVTTIFSLPNIAKIVSEGYKKAIEIHKNRTKLKQ